MPQKILIGKKQDFPEGEGKVVDINGVKYAVFNENGEIRVLDNTCPHEGGPLGEGMLSEGKVTCPLHGWVFDVGSGQCEFFENVRVQAFKVSMGGDGSVFVEISDKEPDDEPESNEETK